MRGHIKRIMAGICLFCMCCLFMSYCQKNPFGNDNTVEAHSEVLQKLGKGWVLGNTLDSIAYKKGETPEFYETYWDNPVTTREMINTVKKAGFTAVRVPVTWYDKVDENGIIDPDWMARVKQVVNYVIENDMACIINLHHDTGETAWIKADVQKADETNAIVALLWKQIAESFKNYDDRLLFEGYNELLNTENNWNECSVEEYCLANRLNQTFVDTVRASGGQNASRYLILNTYAASTNEYLLNAFVLPTDKAKGKLIASVHYYNTNNYEISQMFERLNKRFISHNIPVIIGEFGSRASEEIEQINVERRNYARYFVLLANDYNIGYFWWDDGGKSPDGRLTLMDRYNCTWYDEELVDILTSTSNYSDSKN